MSQRIWTDRNFPSVIRPNYYKLWVILGFSIFTNYRLLTSSSSEQRHFLHQIPDLAAFVDEFRFARHFSHEMQQKQTLIAAKRQSTLTHNQSKWSLLHVWKHLYSLAAHLFDSARPYFPSPSDFCSIFPLIILLCALSSLVCEVWCTAVLRYVSKIETGQRVVWLSV